VIAVGILDSLNPSTVAPALYLAGGTSPRRGLAGLIAGVFAVNMVAGVVLIFGPGQALLALEPHPGFEVRRMIEVGAGAVVFAVAVALWLMRGRVRRHISGREEQIDRSSLLVGAGITAAELPTALPYFAVIAAIVSSGRTLETQIVLLAIFNAAFVMPLLAILLVRGLLGERGRRVVEAARARVDRHIAVAVPAIVLLISAALIARGTLGLVHHHPHLHLHLHFHVPH
jgi:cytochrome c biogenesis protein CcdA